ncbi:insulin-like peptide INSL5 [Bufo gargarizans]|uniref:insulin-like peptide INSL5 n=1 Tax=Bufo gargarizans TaxID=30331 RepID=UPI001CF36C76|nr:insulin-like peptide INSL5 [Bufo gargarizans]
MRVLPACCLLLTLLVAAEQVTADGQFVKLCGREFIRAVIYTCGGSRWRRLLSGQPQDMAGREDFFAVHTVDEDLVGPVEYHVQRINSQNQENLQETESSEEFWGAKKNPAQERRDLNELLTTACCKTGCKKKDLSSLC